MHRRQIAALPMYDFPDLTASHDLWWQAIARQLKTQGLDQVPARLSRDYGPSETWRDPRLLLGQACEYPLARYYRGYVRLVATPRYTVPGCEAGLYRSAIIVRREAGAEALEGLRGLRAAVNEPSSNSGMNLFRAWLAPSVLAERFFASVTLSGSHWMSARMVADGHADVAAIDCVTLAHLRRCDPSLVARLKVIAHTPASPCLPYVTAREAPEATVAALRLALAAASTDPELAELRARLFIDGFEFTPDEQFKAVLALEEAAAAAGYPVLR